MHPIYCLLWIRGQSKFKQDGTAIAAQRLSRTFRGFMNGYLHVQHAVPAQILRGRQVDAMYKRPCISFHLAVELSLTTPSWRHQAHTTGITRVKLKFSCLVSCEYSSESAKQYLVTFTFYNRNKWMCSASQPPAPPRFWIYIDLKGLGLSPTYRRHSI